MEGFTRREVEEARRAREVQAMVGHPTDRDFLGMVRANYILNCPGNDSAVRNANTIFSPDLTRVRGGTVRRPPEAVRTDFVHIPCAVLERHRQVVLMADVMFVNGVPFLVSVARGLNLITAKFLPTHTAKSLGSTIDQIKHLYGRGGYKVGTILMDNEFKKNPTIRSRATHKHHSSEGTRPGGRAEEQAHKGAGTGDTQHPSCQAHAAGDINRTNLPCGPMAKRVSIQVGDIRVFFAQRTRPLAQT